MSPDHLDGSHVRTYITLYLQFLCIIIIYSTEYVCMIQYIQATAASFLRMYDMNLALQSE